MRDRSHKTDSAGALLAPMTPTGARYVLRAAASRDAVPEQHTRYHTRLFFEFQPLVVLASKLDDIDWLKLDGSEAPNGGVDAQLHFTDGRAQGIEITRALSTERGQVECLEWQHYKAYGWAPLFAGSPYKRPPKNSKEPSPEVDRESTDLDGNWKRERQSYLQLMIDAMCRKSVKSYCSPQPWLLVVFDDWINPIREEKRGWFDPLCRTTLKVTQGVWPDRFGRILFVGQSGQYLYDSKRGRGSVLDDPLG